MLALRPTPLEGGARSILLVEPLLRPYERGRVALLNGDLFDPDEEEKGEVVSSSMMLEYAPALLPLEGLLCLRCWAIGVDVDRCEEDNSSDVGSDCERELDAPADDGSAPRFNQEFFVGLVVADSELSFEERSSAANDSALVAAGGGVMVPGEVHSDSLSSFLDHKLLASSPTELASSSDIVLVGLLTSSISTSFSAGCSSSILLLT